MTLLAWLAVGLALGALTERVVGPPHAPVDAATGLPDGSAEGTDEVGAGRHGRFSRRRIVLWAAVGALALVGLGTLGGYLWAASVFDRIEKVDVSAQLSHGSGTNYLLVGSDNGKQPDQQREGIAGVRSDTIMVLRVQGGRAMMLSLNRDLLVTNPATGQKARLNATYAAGPANLVEAVTRDFQIPIDRYLEIDFASFGGLVDSFGGIDVDFAHPALDRASGLNVPEAGRIHLDGDQALAYVRSRRYTEVIDGREVPEGGLPDVNRTERQQVFLRQIMKKAGTRRNPLALMSAARKMSGGLRVDDRMSLFDAARFAWSMGKLDPESVVLPVVPRTTAGGAAVLDLGAGADAVLGQFR